MADIQKIISANPLNQGASILHVNKFGDMTRVGASGLPQFTIEAIQSGYDTRFDDYGLRRKTIQIGDWNMDSTGSIGVAHGLAGTVWQNMRSVDIVVRNDGDDVYYDDSQVAGHISVSGVNSTNVELDRAAATASPSGLFDHPDFDATSYNRGWVTVWYE
jgi:hypothetical protein